MKFEVPGPPVAKQRPRKGQHGNFYTPRRTVEYQNQVGWEARAAGVKLDPDGWYAVYIEFHVSTMRSDLDNCAKSVLDGLDELDGWDDRQLTELRVKPVTVKDGSEEKTIVEILEGEES